MDKNADLYKRKRVLSFDIKNKFQKPCTGTAYPIGFRLPLNENEQQKCSSLHII